MRFLNFALTLAALALPQIASAACEGRDLMTQLPASELNRITAAADATPYGSGLLWHASKGDSTITVFGTYHFRHDLTQAHMDALTPLIDVADDVYLETGGDDMGDAKRAMASEPDLIFITDGPSMIDQLSPEDWQTYSAAMEQRAIPGFMAAKFKPFFGAMFLSLGPCLSRSGAMEQAGIDMLVNDYAADKAASLEDWRAMLGTIDAMPQDKQIEMLRMSFGYIDQADDLSHTLLQRYLDQDIALLWEYTKAEALKAGATEKDFADMEKPLLIDRNIAWADLLKTRAADAQVFVAVGAGHLPGEFGLLNLLAQQGYTLKRLPFQAR